MPLDEREQRVDYLFHAASELPPEKRAPFLDRECTGDPPEIRHKVEAMLEPHRLGNIPSMPGMKEIAQSQYSDPMIGSTLR